MSKIINHNNIEWELAEENENDQNYEYCEISEWDYKRDICYDSVKRLTDLGMRQVNIHIMVSKETRHQVFETLNDYVTDPRLKNLNAIVLLSLKQKGRGEKYNQLTQEEFNGIVNHAMKNNIPIGFDSCSCPKFIEVVKDNPRLEEFKALSEPCESSLFSSYIDVDGSFFPCSFTEGTPGWEEGIKVLDYNTFEEVWNHPRTEEFKKRLLANERKCPLYTI